MRVIVVLGALVAALTASTASAGGFATVGFDPLPDGVSAGGTWNPTIFVKQHGITPLTGMHPVVEISDGSGAARTFDARETAEAGVYEAEVVFPSAGDWTVTVHSGFGDSHVTYGPFAVGPAGAVGDSPALPVGVAALALALALAAALVLLGARRYRRLSPVSS
jgi:hypothetical protein